jgi:hypothetical protein
MKGITWTGAQTYAHMGYADFYGASYITVSKWYVHEWSHTGASSSTSSSCTGTCDSLYIILGGTGSSTNAGSVITRSIFDGSDSTNGGDSGAVAYGWPSVTYSIIHDMSNGLLLTGNGDIGNNHIYNIHQSFDASQHENCIEPINGNGSFYIHDNIIHDCYAVSLALGDEGNGQIDYVWNNVFYNLASSNSPYVDGRSAATTTYFWNNTVVPQAGFPCFHQVSGSTYSSTVKLENNHCITTGNLDDFGIPFTATRLGNITQTPAVASSQGYSLSELYVYSPTESSNATVGAGTNLTSSWPSGYSTNDTSYACTLGAGNQVICPARKAVPRTSTWDAGAYSFQAVTAPTSLSASPK